VVDQLLSGLLSAFSLYRFKLLFQELVALLSEHYRSSRETL